MQVGISDVPLGCKRYCRILEETGLRCSGPSAQLRMDAARYPATRGALPPGGWLLSPGRPLRSPGRRWKGGSAAGSPAPLQQLLLLLLPFLLGRATPGAVATSETRIDGRALSVSSLREAESRAFTCLAAAPNLTWYLNGERQETNASGRPLAAAGDASGEDGRGIFVVTARRVDHRLDCAATDPATGRVSTASVLLNVQFQPEIVTVDAHYHEASEPGLLLVLFVLVQANPPADVTWVDQDGQVTVNASRFLLLDAQTYPWLANHTVRVQLHGPPRNASLRASNDLGVASSSVPLPGLLATQLELPLVALVGAAAVALVILLSFGVLISWTVSQAAKKSAGHGPAAQLPLSNVLLQPKEARLPRANRSLPSNLQLNDLALEPKKQIVFLQSKVKMLFRSQKTTQSLLNKIWVNFLPSDIFIKPLV
ncbi:transmembrane protein 25 isoform X2 [Ahaetulla prasina]|uniref:transmembrane protein 25 isoform X2 n=1 Tax=Ahaetulla prasina TaxID=499056 RepID=UPI00264812BD|nr:transmembrane protein 25 isoform X2 [Ahaetulla prasina]